jgi:hypothetical protein
MPGVKRFATGACVLVKSLEIDGCYMLHVCQVLQPVIHRQAHLSQNARSVTHHRRHNSLTDLQSSLNKTAKTSSLQLLCEGGEGLLVRHVCTGGEEQGCGEGLRSRQPLRIDLVHGPPFLGRVVIY